MKNRSCKFLSVILCLLLCLSVVPLSESAVAKAEIIYPDHYIPYYSEYGTIYYVVENNEACIVACDKYEYVTDLVIPSEIDGYPVTGIAEYAFMNNSIKTVIIPDSITYIGAGAFYDCNLESLNIPDSVAFIGEGAFADCKNLASVNIPASIETIAGGLFGGCDNLKTVNISEGILSIEMDVFAGCKSLTSITLPESLQYIGEGAFMWTGLTCLEIPANVTYVGNMFMDVFLEKFIVSEENEYYCTDENGVLFNKDKTTLIACPGSLDVTSYTIPDGVITIAPYAFACNFRLKEITVSEGVKEIGECAFANMVFLEKINLASTVERIDFWAFYYDVALKEIVIPESVKYVNESFAPLLSLEKAVIYSRDLDLTGSYFGCTLNPGNTAEEKAAFCAAYQKRIVAQYTFDDEKWQEADKELELLNEKFGDREDPFAYTCPIYCYQGSSAEAYAKENNIEYRYIRCEIHTEELVPGRDSTCTQTGLTEGKKCAVCSLVLLEQTEIPVEDHEMQSWVNDYDAGTATRNCKNCAYTETVALDVQDNNDVEIIAPENPDLDFDIAGIDKNSDSFVLVKNTVKENTEEKYEVLKVFDITLKNNDGVHVQPDGTVKVKLPIDLESEGNYKVYRVNDDGSLTDMQAVREGNHMVFETDHFSIYVIVGDVVADEEPPIDEKPPQDSEENIFETFANFILTLLKLIARLIGIFEKL
ncbi:MAG: leucine-rich repeat domain-containing protein [Clostridia bacterium]|nr:leucine-rich repeat domain-containing protein [Clostridia bacterium]